MKKVISFSLYKAPKKWEDDMNTTYEKYLIGLYENINLVNRFYPNWSIYLYHNDELDLEIINELKNKYNVETKLVLSKTISAMQWRFLPNDEEDVELFIVRDVDSRITEREQTSVMEWIESGKILHIMRDHPHHTYSILGGMWGMRKQSNLNMMEECVKYNKNKNYNIDSDWYEKWWDMNFLRDVIYPKYIHSSYINSETGTKMEDWSTPFTKQREDRKFVGEIYIDKNKREYHYTLL